MNIQYGQLENLNWIWLVAGVAVISCVAMIFHRRSMSRFATSNLLRRMVPGASSTHFTSGLLKTLAMIAIVIALVDIRWGKVWREVPQKGIEVMFALDISRSMLAEDTSPSRLERAKQDIKDLVDEMAGDRVGLVLFAGDVKQHIPLTNHYEDFKQRLDEVGPYLINRGGSNLGDAITIAADSFLSKTADHKAIVLITDGEDHESKPVDAAKKAFREHGARIFTVGLGDMEHGARIPVESRNRGRSFMQHDGKQVWSRLDGEILKQIAAVTDGAYIPAGTKQVDMAAVYHNYIAGVEQQDFETAKINSYVPRYHWFLGFALGSLLLQIVIASSRSKKSISEETETRAFETFPMEPVIGQDSRTHMRPTGNRSKLKAGMLLIVAAGLALLPANLTAQSKNEIANKATESIRNGEFETAIQHFENVINENADQEPDARLLYNQGIAYYRSGDVETARQRFTQVVGSADPELAAKARFNIGNANYATAVKIVEQDKQAAIEQLKSAIGHYQSALQLNRSDNDARANIELAARMIKQLQQQAKQEQEQEQNKPEQEQHDQKNQQQQDSSEQDQSEQENSEQDSEQSQENPNNQSQEEKNSKNQDSEEDGSDNKESDDQESGDRERQKQQAGNQQEQADTEHEQSESGDQPAENEAPQDTQQQSDIQQNSQRNQNDDPQNEDPKNENGQAEQPLDPNKEQEIPAGELKALNNADEKNESNEQAGEGGQPMSATAMKEGQTMTMQEAQKMLQAVRDREFRRRIEKLQQMRTNRVPVEKDW